MGVFDIEDMGKKGSKAIVKNPRSCTTCRECKRQEQFSSRVNLEKFKSKFEFTVETVGVIKPEDIVKASFGVLKEKSEKWIHELSELTQQTQNHD